MRFLGMQQAHAPQVRQRTMGPPERAYPDREDVPLRLLEDVGRRAALGALLARLPEHAGEPVRERLALEADVTVRQPRVLKKMQRARQHRLTG